MGLSASIDRAVKAYIDHTQSVLDGDTTLNISYLTQPFNNTTAVVQAAHHAMQQPVAIESPEETVDGPKKRKRTYRPRDPNAPKRPLTAYFRYLQEQRPILMTDAKNGPDGENTKAGDISKIATDRWNNMSDGEQAPYRAAYQADMRRYEDAVKAYRASTGANEPRSGDDAAVLKNVTVHLGDVTTAGDEIEEDSPEPPSPVQPKSAAKSKAASPETQKKTPKAAASKAKQAATALAPTPKFSSINPPPAVAAAPEKPQSPARKRKAAAMEGEEGEKKRGGRKTKAEKAAAAAADDAAAAAAQLVIEPEVSATAKKEKKKRKSEPTA